MSDLYVPGVAGRVNRYFICSERLRKRGWRGVGNTWWMPASGELSIQKDTGPENTLTFAEALTMTGIGRSYAWEVQKFVFERSMMDVGRKLGPKFEAIREAAEKAAQVFVKSEVAEIIKASTGEK